MKQYIIGKVNLVKAVAVALTVSLVVYSCSDDMEKTSDKHNFSMDFSTRAGETANDLATNMRLFTFYDNASANDKMFRQEVLNLTRSTNKVTAQLETGKWNLAMVSAPAGSITMPTAADVMSEIPMYIYNPTFSNGKSTDAAEIYFQNKVTPTITEGGTHTMDAQLNRTVAKVQLILRKTTSNFKLNGDHLISLHNIPSTISYTGKLLPDQHTPDTLSGPLQAKIALTSHETQTGFLQGADMIEFIIPAHQGNDFLTTAKDTTTLKMQVTVKLERSGAGSDPFIKHAQVVSVAKCNQILRIHIDVNDGLLFETEYLKWDQVNMSDIIGQEYSNWLYVKKGATGNGLSWSDPLGDINTAILMANALTTANHTIHGILVAGGSDLVYDEAFTVPANVKIFGGWEGETGTELGENDVTGPYTSTARKLKTHKVYLSTGAASVKLPNANSVLDGFVIQGTGESGAATGLVNVSNATAWVNAVEIDQQTINSTYALAVSNGVATNILASRNTKGVSVTSGGKIVNATIADNTAASVFTGSLLNSVYWRNSGTATITGTINHCAFDGTVPTGTNYPLNTTNDIWFTATNLIPGPHFDLGATAGLARYEVGTPKPTRAPMLRRGSKAVFDSNLPVVIADQYKKDINGNIRYHIAIDGTTQVVDMGCYEDGSHAGFQLQWATEDVYVSAKKGYFSQLPLLLPANEDPDINIEVKWTVTVQGGSLTNCSFDGSVVNDVATGLNTGSGSGVMVGMVQFTPTVEYTTNAEWQLGTITISTQLGAYLPNVDVKVFQTSGKQFKWTQGYVGSFHRYNERGARFIHGYNQLGGDWTVRIFSGLDWIKIDQNEKNHGEDVEDTEDGLTPSGGKYKEVEEAWGGVITGSGADIKFRVGMKSKNTTGKPRYGLIIITRSGGVSYFFVRQGEDPDYVYRIQDTRPTAGARTAANVKKFSMYNISTDATPLAAGNQFNARGGKFTKYPTQVGYYFKSNTTIGYLFGTATSTSASSGNSSWNNTREVCPTGYRHASQMEYIHSLYYDVADNTSGQVAPTGEASRKNYENGAYADGWYDQLLPSRSSSYVNVSVGGGVGYATKGTLIVSHYNYASVFFPAAGNMTSTGNLTRTVYAMYHTNNYRNTHWGQEGNSDDTATDTYGHIGMNCTSIGTTNAAPVRCIKE